MTRPATAADERFYRAAAVVSVVAAVLFNLYVLQPDLANTSPQNNDDIFHLTNLRHASQAIASGTDPTDVWVPEIAMGYPVFHYYQQIPYVIPAGVHHLTGIELDTAFRWVKYLLVSAFPLSMLWSMRRMDFGWLEAGAAAALSSTLSAKRLFGFELESYVFGGFSLYTQLWGMFFLPMAVAQTYRTLREGDGWAMAVMLLAATTLSHLAFGYIALGTAGVLVILTPSTASIRLRAGRLVLLGIPFIMITSYFLVPLILDREFLNRSVWDPPEKYDSYGASWVMSHLLRGELFDHGRPPIITVLAGIGMLTCLMKRDQEHFRVPIAIFVLWLLLYFGRPTWGVAIDLLPLMRDFHLQRLIAGVDLGVIMLAGIGVAAPLRWLFARRSPRTAAIAMLGLALLAYPVIADRIEFRNWNRDLVANNTAAFQNEQADLDALTAALRQQPEGRVFAGLPSTWGSGYKISDVPMYNFLAGEGFDMLGYEYHPWSLNGDLQLLFDETRQSHYDLFNVRYVVAPFDRQAPSGARLIGEYGRHRLYALATSGYFDVVSAGPAVRADKTTFFSTASTWLRGSGPDLKRHPIIDFPGASDGLGHSTAAPGSVTRESVGQGYYSAIVDSAAVTQLLLKTTFHPGWKAFVDGKQVSTSMLMPSFLGIEVPSGRHEVEFVYTPTHQRRWLLLLMPLTLGAVVITERSSTVRRALGRLRTRFTPTT
jgi:Bacterial membrane protein YfhO